MRSRDQLGELAESFNHMARGIEDLLREQAEKERLEEELRIARQIQMSLLPADRAPHVPGLRIAALCLPAAEVGGDYYDLLPLSDDRLGVLVADVSGKGTSAALYMAELKGLVLSLSRIYDSPARLLSEANRILAANMDSRSFITMTYAVVDVAPADDALRARRPQPDHPPRGGAPGAPASSRRPGLGLGIDRGARFDEILEEEEVRPAQRRHLPLLHRRPLRGHERRVRALRRAPPARHPRPERAAVQRGDQRGTILAEIRAFVGEAAQHDDMTMVILKVV